LPLTDLCVAAALDAVKAGVTLPWGTTGIPDKGTPPTDDVSAGESGARAPVIKSDLESWGESSTITDPVSASTIESPSLSTSSSADTTTVSPEIGANLERPHRVISLSNFEQALKEITPSLSESLGTLSELRKWNDEFGEGKREKRRNMWGKGSFGFVEKGEGRDAIKVAASAGAGGGKHLSA